MLHIHDSAVSWIDFQSGTISSTGLDDDHIMYYIYLSRDNPARSGCAFNKLCFFNHA